MQLSSSSLIPKTSTFRECTKLEGDFLNFFLFGTKSNSNISEESTKKCSVSPAVVAVFALNQERD